MASEDEDYLFSLQLALQFSEHEYHESLLRLNERSIEKPAETSVGFHSFHEEVDNYHTHWWRCNGPCQHQRPFYGIVQRAMNRPPSESDPWWADHKHKCGGTFNKIRKPHPKYIKRKPKDSTLPVNSAMKKPKLVDGADIPPRSVSESASVSDSQSQDTTDPKHVSSATDLQRSQVAPHFGIGHTLGGCSSKSQLLEEGSSRSESIVEFSCVLEGVSSQMQDLQSNEAAPSRSAESIPGQSNKCITEAEVKPALQKPSCSTRPTLKDFLGEETQPPERSATKMKFVRDLLSSDSECDDDCVIIFDTTVKEQGKSTGKLDQASTSSSLSSADVSAPSNVSTRNVLALVECPICGQFIEKKFMKSHLDMCVIEEE